MRLQFVNKYIWESFFYRSILQNSRKYKFKQLMETVKHANYSIKSFYKPLVVMFIWPTKLKLSPETKVDLTPSVIEVADRLFESGKYEECHKILCGYEKQDDIEIKWRLCRVLYNMAKLPKYNQEYKCELITKAYNIIAKELDTHWDNFAVQKWYALILDIKSSNDGLKRRIEELGNVRKHMELAIKLNPNDATLLHMLGEWCYQVTEVPWHQRKTAETLFAALPHSTYEDALEYFLKAEEAQPRFYSINLLRLGSCYLKLKKEDQAKYYLKLAASYPAKSNDDHHANKEATELLKKIKRK